LADHAQPIRYEIPLPPRAPADAKEPVAKAAQLYIHPPRGRTSRHIDDPTEHFVDDTRMGAAK
jgi:hypothetical protein